MNNDKYLLFLVLTFYYRLKIQAPAAKLYIYTIIDTM